MIDTKWHILFQNLAREFGYTPQEIGNLSLAQIQGLFEQEKQGHRMTPAEVKELTEKMRNRHGVQTG